MMGGFDFLAAGSVAAVGASSAFRLSPLGGTFAPAVTAASIGHSNHALQTTSRSASVICFTVVLSKMGK
jgi:hypothetical protein